MIFGLKRSLIYRQFPWPHLITGGFFLIEYALKFAETKPFGEVQLEEISPIRP